MMVGQKSTQHEKNRHDTLNENRKSANRFGIRRESHSPADDGRDRADQQRGATDASATAKELGDENGGDEGIKTAQGDADQPASQFISADR